MKIGLASFHHGRHEHLRRQAAAVARLDGAETLARYLVVSLDASPPPPGAEGLAHPAPDPDALPLAAARNAAIAALADLDLVILLDVDCIPDRELLTRYRAAATGLDLTRSLLLGPVGWLSEPPPASRRPAEPALEPPDDRPVPAAHPPPRAADKRGFPDTGVAAEPRPELFWSLNYAVAPSTHRSLGGFDEAYAGWGAEDTDYGRRAAAAGVTLWKVAGAWADHQPHPPARRSPGQIAALAANAERFHARWGDWPMPDVLAELAAAGRITWTPQSSRLTLPGSL